MQQHAKTVFLAPVLVHATWGEEARWTSLCFGPGQKDPMGIPVSLTTAAKPAQLAVVLEENLISLLGSIWAAGRDCATMPRHRVVIAAQPSSRLAHIRAGPSVLTACPKVATLQMLMERLVGKTYNKPKRCRSCRG